MTGGKGYSRAEAERMWRQRSLTELVDHLEQTHHVYTRTALPAIARLIEDALVDNSGDQRLKELQSAFQQFTWRMIAHVQAEERDLFPLCRALESTSDFLARGSLMGAVQTMIREHDESADDMERLRALCFDYRPPDTAGPVWAGLCRAVKEFEDDLHAHVHKENNLLALRALQV